jgi:hypothetical protein
MPFVKLDREILNSSLWVDRDGRDVFITALLMAEPFELKEPAPQLSVRTAEPTGWVVPPGWYGRVGAAGVGIVRQALVDREQGLAALEILGEGEKDSRTTDHDGRRMVRVEGGFLILNFFKYRDKDYTAKDRMRRLRDRRKATVTANDEAVRPNVTHSRDREQRQSSENRNGNDISLPGDARVEAREASKKVVVPGMNQAATIKEGYRLANEISALAKLNVEEVLNKASRYQGGGVGFIALDSMTIPRLGHTVNALRTWHRTLTGQAEPEIPKVEAKPYISDKAKARHDGANAEILGGMKHDGSVLGRGVPEAPRVSQGSGLVRRDEDAPGKDVPGKAGPSQR